MRKKDYFKKFKRFYKVINSQGNKSYYKIKCGYSEKRQRFCFHIKIQKNDYWNHKKYSCKKMQKKKKIIQKKKKKKKKKKPNIKKNPPFGGKKKKGFFFFVCGVFGVSSDAS